MHTFYHAAIRTKDDLRMRSILEHVSSLNGGVIKEDRYFTNNPLTFGTVSAGDDVAQKLPPDRSYFSLLNKVLESNNKIIETINTLHGANTPPTSQPGPYRHIESTGETDNDTDISS